MRSHASMQAAHDHGSSLRDGYGLCLSQCWKSYIHGGHDGSHIWRSYIHASTRTYVVHALHSCCACVQEHIASLEPCPSLIQLIMTTHRIDFVSPRNACPRTTHGQFSNDYYNHIEIYMQFSFVSARTWMDSKSRDPKNIHIHFHS